MTIWNNKLELKFHNEAIREARKDPEMNLEIPTIHLNGTPKQSLLDDINDAYQVVAAAQIALAATGPNGRDYYKGLKAGADYDRLAKAVDEHQARMTKLHDILKELEELAKGIDTQ